MTIDRRRHKDSSKQSTFCTIILRVESELSHELNLVHFTASSWISCYEALSVLTLFMLLTRIIAHRLASSQDQLENGTQL
jgi:hypothetical protein